MAHRSDPELLVALALRLKGFGEVSTIASVHGLGVDETGVILSRMAEAEKCVMRQVEAVEKYVLTPAGREQGQAALARELEVVDARRAMEAAPEVVECHNITGAFEYLLRVESRDLASYKHFHTEDLGTHRHVSAITAYIVMSSPKDGRA